MTAAAIELHSPAALAIRPGQQMWTDKQKAALAVLGIKGATNADLAVFMHYCQKTGLDPFSKQIYGIMRREKQNGEWVDKFTIQVGIDGFRVIRDRAAERLGVEVEYEDTFWYDADGGAHKVWLWEDPPAACSLAVLKNGKRYPAVLTFAEYVQKNRDGDATGKWRDAPAHQIEKCCEAFALRRAFPHDLGGVYLEDEMPAQEPGAPTTIRQRGRVTVAEVIEQAYSDVPPDDDVPPDEPPGDGAPAAQRKPQPATSGQLSMIGRALAKLGIDDQERPRTLERMAGRDLTGDAPLTQDEAVCIRDLLGKCATRDDVIELLATGQMPEPQQEEDGGDG